MGSCARSLQWSGVMNGRTLDRKRPRRRSGADSWVRTGHLKLWLSEPEVEGYTLFTTALTDALVSGGEGRAPGLLLASGAEPIEVKTALTVRRMVTVGGLVASTNTLLEHLDLPFRLLPLASSDDVVARVSVREALLFGLSEELDPSSEPDVLASEQELREVA